MKCPGEDKCSYCPSGMADTMSCPKHINLMASIQQQTRKHMEEDTDDLEANHLPSENNNQTKADVHKQ